MLQAKITALRSPDPNTQVGACLVKDKKIIGSGYNGTPRGINPEIIPWSREAASPSQTKYPYIVHAEVNAILNTSNYSLLDKSQLYVTLYPCCECAKIIVQVGIAEIYFLSNPYKETDSIKVAQWIFEQTRLKVKEFQWDTPKTLELLIK